MGSGTSYQDSKWTNDEEELKKCLVKIVEFGSYLLGVHFPQTDIDAICVFKAKYVTHQ